MKIVYLGDVVGKPGRTVIKKNILELRKKYNFDLLFINAENSAGGRGINKKIADEIFAMGADFITLGDHVWDEKDIIPYLEKHTQKIIKPANIASKKGGKGYAIFKYKNTKIGVFSLLGRVFMSGLYDCPFKTADKILEELKDCPVKILDFHAEATSEKNSILHYLSGKVSLIVGTHTHVQTADEHIRNGTAYITDLGMCGSHAHVIGMDKGTCLARFIDIPKRFEPGKGEERISGIIAEIDDKTGKALKIERI